MNKLLNIPLPKLSNLVMLYAKGLKNIEKELPYNFYKNIYTDKARRSVKAIYQLKEKEINRKPTIYIPAYICNELIQELISVDAKIFFYDALNYKILKERKIDIFLYVNYFGNQNKKAKNFCNFIKEKDTWIIEDSTHCSFIRNNCRTSDFIIYSPYKIYGTLNGSILLVNKKLKKEFKFLKNYLITEENKFIITTIKTFLQYIKWLIKIIAYKYKLFIRIPEFDFKNNNQKKDTYFLPYKLSLRLINLETKNIEEINNKRLSNEIAWDHILYIICPFLIKIRNNSIPYLSVYKMKPNKFNINNILLFRQYGIPFSNWPNLPDEIVKNKDKYRKTFIKRKSYIMLPCHQSLKREEIYFKALDSFKKIVNSYKKNLDINNDISNIIFTHKQKKDPIIKIKFSILNAKYKYLKIDLGDKYIENSFFTNNLIFCLIYDELKRFNGDSFILLLPSSYYLDNYYSKFKRINKLNDDLEIDIDKFKKIFEDINSNEYKNKPEISYQYFVVNNKIFIYRNQKKIYQQHITFIKNGNSVEFTDINLDLIKIDKYTLLSILRLLKNKSFKKLKLSNNIINQILRNMTQDKYFKLKTYIMN